MSTALMVTQVKIQPYLFTSDHPLFTMNGPKKSTPTKVNGGLFAVARSLSKLAIFCSARGACLRQWLKHLDSSLRTAELALMTQNLSRSKDKT